MARRNLAFAALGPLAISLALVACTGAASPNPTSEVLGETSEPVAPASEPASSEAGATSGAGSSEQAGAEAAVCTALQTWSDDMRALTSVDTTTASVDDVRAQVDKVKADWDAVKSSLEAVDAADKDALEQAGDSMKDTLDSLSTDVPVADMVAQAKTAADPLKGAYQEMANGMGCTLSNPY